MRALSCRSDILKYCGSARRPSFRLVLITAHACMAARHVHVNARLSFSPLGLGAPQRRAIATRPTLTDSFFFFDVLDVIPPVRTSRKMYIRTASHRSTQPNKGQPVFVITGPPPNMKRNTCTYVLYGARVTFRKYASALVQY